MYQDQSLESSFGPGSLRAPQVASAWRHCRQGFVVLSMSKESSAPARSAAVDLTAIQVALIATIGALRGIDDFHFRSLHACIRVAFARPAGKLMVAPH
jgi:hypothetical protein